jgi:hypothetical protein
MPEKHEVRLQVLLLEKDKEAYANNRKDGYDSPVAYAKHTRYCYLADSMNPSTQRKQTRY